MLFCPRLYLENFCISVYETFGVVNQPVDLRGLFIIDVWPTDLIMGLTYLDHLALVRLLMSCQME